MGIPVLIMGESGSGKSASMRNMVPEKVGVFNVAGKPLPFKNGKNFKTADNPSYKTIMNSLKNAKLKCYVIDDSQYLMAFDFFNKSKEVGYQKFTEIGYNFEQLIRTVQTDTPHDCIVYFLHHTEQMPNGSLKAKTIGKMLDEKLTVEGLFSIVLMCVADENKHVFLTQSNGISTAKSPMDMFDLEIDNDLKMVDETIREYYGLNEEDKNKE